MSESDAPVVVPEKKGLAAMWETLNQWLPWIVIGAALAWSSWVVGTRQFRKITDDRIVIRLSHWQLEQGVRDGINEAAAEYQKLHPNVRIAQEAIPDSAYGQWLTTQMLGDNAPDIVQVGQVSENVRIMMLLRYLLPLTPYVNRPNPYNKGTELEGVPLQETMLDGMQMSYDPEVQEYMSISLARMSVRVIYNKTLLKQLTGLDTPPSNFRDFIKVCEEIQKHKMPNGLQYAAICNSAYHNNAWNGNIAMTLTYPMFREMDFNRDGRFGKEEWAIAYLTGKIGLKDRPNAAAFTVLQELRPFFQPGWVGLQRDEAIFSFAQQKGVFMSCGLWEAGGITQLAKGQFEVGVMDFPVLARNDPQFGDLAEGVRFEKADGTIPFSITRSSKHPEIALDFLFFLASQKQNERFNERLHWLPLTVGAKALPELKPYEPSLVGVFSAFDPVLGAETTVRWKQLFDLFNIGQITFDELSETYAKEYKSIGTSDFEEFRRNVRRPGVRKEQMSSILRARALLDADPQKAATAWLRFRQVQMDSLGSNNNYITYEKALTDKGFYSSQQIYKYTPEALQRVGARVTGTAAPATTPAAPSTTSVPTPQPTSQP